MTQDSDLPSITPRWRDPMSVAVEAHRRILLRRLRRHGRPRR